MRTKSGAVRRMTLRKLTHALRTAHDLRKQGNGAAENAANCIESLVREVERLTAQGH